MKIDKNINDALDKAKKDFLERLPKTIDSINDTLEASGGKAKKDIDLASLSSVVRELHNIKSVAGSYGLDFIASAVRNILDHSAYIYELNSDDIVDLELGKKILVLIKNFITNYQNSEEELHQSKLNSLITQKQTKKRVLVVEKDPLLCDHLKSSFEQKNFSYSFVESGVEAFNRLLTEKYDLLITDLHVGKLDGPSLIAATRVSNCVNKNIKTLMLSVSYFDLLPSISMPDYFVSKNEKILVELDKVLLKFSEKEEKVEDSEPLRILSLDDDENIHDLLKISFSSHNITYDFALEGSEFISKFLDNKPDLVILDLILENESGVDVIKKIKKKLNYFDVPVIVLTSLDGQLRAELLSEIPFIIGNLSKPFTPKVMAKEVMDLYKQNKRSTQFN